MVTQATERVVSPRVLVKDALALIDEYIEDSRAGNYPSSKTLRSSFTELREQAKRVVQAESTYDINEVFDRISSAQIDIIATFEMAKANGTSLQDAWHESLGYRKLLGDWCFKNWR